MLYIVFSPIWSDSQFQNTTDLLNTRLSHDISFSENQYLRLVLVADKPTSENEFSFRNPLKMLLLMKSKLRLSHRIPKRQHSLIPPHFTDPNRNISWSAFTEVMNPNSTSQIRNNLHKNVYAENEAPWSPWSSDVEKCHTINNQKTDIRLVQSIKLDLIRFKTDLKFNWEKLHFEQFFLWLFNSVMLKFSLVWKIRTYNIICWEISDFQNCERCKQ